MSSGYKRSSRPYSDDSISSDASFLSDSSETDEGPSGDEEERVGLRGAAALGGKRVAGAGVKNKEKKKGKRVWVMGSQPKSQRGQGYEDAPSEEEEEGQQTQSDENDEKGGKKGQSAAAYGQNSSEPPTDSDDDEQGHVHHTAGKGGQPQQGGDAEEEERQRKNKMYAWIAAGVAVLVIAALLVWWFFLRNQSDSDSSSSSSSSSSSDLDSASSTPATSAAAAASTTPLTTAANLAPSTPSSNLTAMPTVAASNLTANAGLGTTAASKKPTPTSSAYAVDPSATYAAQITWFQSDNVPKSCGSNPNDGDYVVLVSEELYGDPDSVSPMCGKWMTLYQLEKDSYVRATIEGVCEGCTGHNLVLSRAVFNALTQNMDLGTTLAQWWWTDKEHKPKATLKTYSPAAAAKATGAKTAGAGIATGGVGTVEDGEVTLAVEPTGKATAAVATGGAEEALETL